MKMSAKVRVAGASANVTHAHPDHHAHRGQVVDQARHQVADFVLVVEVGAEMGQMDEQVVAQIVLDVAARVENRQARKPSRGAANERRAAQHQHDSIERLLRGKAELRQRSEGLRVMRLHGGDGGAAQIGDRHAAGGRDQRAQHSESVPAPIAADVEEQSFHGLTVKISGLRRDRRCPRTVVHRPVRDLRRRS